MHIQSNFRAGLVETGIAQSDRDICALLGAMRPTAITLYAADTTIYNDGDVAGPLYLVEFGTIRIARVTADGRRQITSFHTAGDVFGFEADGFHSSSAEAIDAAGVRVLRPVAGEQPNGSLLLLALRSLARTQQHLMVLGRRTASERFASLLLDLAERQGDDQRVHLPMQRNDIADYLGITFETVSRILRTFRERGLIHLHSVSDIDILDLDALEALCE